MDHNHSTRIIVIEFKANSKLVFTHVETLPIQREFLMFLALTGVISDFSVMMPVIKWAGLTSKAGL